MLTTPTTSMRWMLASTLTVLAVCAAFVRGANAQTTAPPVVASSATVLTLTTAQTGTTFAGTQQPGVDHFGNFVFTDYVNGGLFEIPAGTTNVITLVPDGALGSGNYAEPSVTFDSQNNMLIPGEFSNCLLLFPWDPAKQTWDGLSTLTAKNTGAGNCATYPYGFANYGETNLPAGYIQPWGVAFVPNTTYPSTGTIAVGNQNPTFLFTMSISYPGVTQAVADATNGCDGSQKYPGPCSPTAVPGNYTTLITATTARIPTVAADPWGNIFFTEDKSSGGLPGVYMVPAGVTNLATDTASQIVEIDPNLPNVDGVATDAAGNVYISDSKLGVYVVPADPATGSPDISKYFLLTPIPATSAVAIDSSRGLLYFTTTNNAIAIISIGAADLGTTAVGTAASASTSVAFSFDQAETPASFAIEEAGVATPDFTIGTGGTCAAQTAQAAESSCTVNVTLDPQNAGNLSASVVALDGTGNVLGSFDLHGTGTGATVNVLPGAETPIDAGLKTPAQVAVDAAGNTYVADSGLNQVLMFAKGSTTGTAIGAGLTKPTGVAVDGAGDVFIADSGSGTVVEIPVGPSGLNAAGQITLKSGLGTAGLSLATDGAGHLYITDPQNNQVVKLTNPGAGLAIAGTTESDLNAANGYTFNAPSAVATDSSEDLYVADGSNLIEVTPSGTQSTVLTNLSGATGLAIDPSGSVYIAETGGVVRVPNVSGKLTASAQAAVAQDVTNPTSVALDAHENLYIADGANADVDVVSASASTNFGTQATPTSTISPASYTVLNSGNSSLTVSGFTSTSDFSVTSQNCTGASTSFAPDASCSATVTFNPGPGDSGTLSAFLQVQGNETNQPVGINATGIGAALAGTTTSIVINSPTVDNAPVVVTVTPATAGATPAPTGTVTLTISGGSLTAPVVKSGTLTAGTTDTATVTLTPPQLPVGSYTFAVSYQGDRVYSGSTATAAVTLAANAIILSQPTLAQMQTQDGTYVAEPGATLNSDGSCCATYGSAYVNGVLYVLSTNSGSNESYDGTPANIWYSYPMTVTTPSGAPLLGVPVYQTSASGTIQTDTNYGSITFSISGPTSLDTTAAQNDCSSIKVNADGTANFGTYCLPIDTSDTSIPNFETSYTVTPSYSPAYLAPGSNNPNYTAVAGTSFTVTALSHPMVVVTASPSTLSFAKGSSASTTLTLTSLLGYGYTGANGNQNNYALPVDLECDGLPAYATCSFTYPPAPKASQWNPNPDPNAAYVTPLGTPTPDGENVGPAQVVMTITTNILTGDNASLMRRSGKTEWAGVFGLSLLGLAFGKRRSLRGRLMVMLCVLLTSGIVAGSTGCSTTQLGGGGTQVTPAGTYQVLVTAKQTGSAYIIADASSQPWVYGSGNQVSLPLTVNVTIQ